MLELPVATTSDYGALAALLQVYDEQDYWYGERFADVVEQFIACPPKLDDPGYLPTNEDRVRFRDLYAMGPLLATERRDRLVADIMALLERYPNEDQRREQVMLRDKKELLAFDDFWAEESWSLDFTRAAGNLLTIAVAHARAWDPHARDETVACLTHGSTPEQIQAHDQRRSAILRARNKRASEAFEALREL